MAMVIRLCQKRMSSPTTRIDRTHHLDMDVCQCDRMVERIHSDDAYAQNFYAALCNQEWYEQDAWEILRDHTWRVSWRTAGGIVADIRGSGDYMDWYCSGMGGIGGYEDDAEFETWQAKTKYVPEGEVTDEIRADFARLGWYPSHWP